MTCDDWPQLKENFEILFGASVSARSVKIINEKTTERDTWWQELRKEMEKNALFLDCTHIMGYLEINYFYENLMIMSAYGTAIKLRNRKSSQNHVNQAFNELQKTMSNKNIQ